MVAFLIFFLGCLQFWDVPSIIKLIIYLACLLQEVDEWFKNALKLEFQSRTTLNYMQGKNLRCRKGSTQRIHYTWKDMKSWSNVKNVINMFEMLYKGYVPKTWYKLS